MSMKIREFIKKIRACKTAEEERSVVNKESAEMRNLHKEANNQIKSRNLMKCIWMHMMGHSTTFIHVITVNLLASQNFTEKRIAYLSLCMLLDEKSEVLLLCTQTIKKDLSSNNFSIISMALNTIGEVCTVDMCRELSQEVSRLMLNANSYIKKKAACAGSKIIRKCPELIEIFVPNLKSYFEEKNHAVLLTGITLAVQIFQAEPIHIQKFNKYLQVFTKQLKGLITISYSPEFDVNGITDPFLQSKLLEVMQFLGRENRNLSEEMREILTNVSSSTEGSKVTGNAILYELVRTINGIHSDTGLKSIASTILGKFLSNRDNNYKYIALNTLREVVKTDITSVQKHKNTILECLKDTDISIKRRALDLVYLIINQSNIKQIVNECLNFLILAETEIKLELTSKISQSLNKYSPSIKYQIDSLIKMLCLSQHYVSEDTISHIINVIVHNESLNVYAVHKCFLALKNNYEKEEALTKVCVYVIGELGDVLINNFVIGPGDENIYVTEEEVVSLLKKVENLYSNKSNNSNESNKLLLTNSSTILEYLMSCYLKLTNKFSDKFTQKIRVFLKEETKSYFYEVQQRACEYLNFTENCSEELKREVVGNIPKWSVEEFKDKEDYVEDFENRNTDESEEDKILMIRFKQGGGINEMISGGNIFGINEVNKNVNSTTSNIPAENTNLNLLEIFGNSNLNFNLENNFINANNNLLIPDLTNLNIGMQSVNNNNNNMDTFNLNNLSNLNTFNDITNTPIINNTIFNMDSILTNSNANNSYKEVYRNNDIIIHYDFTKNILDSSLTGSFYVSNITDTPLNNINLKFMVLKHVNLKVLATSGLYLEPRKQFGIKKDFNMTSTDSSKKIVMKIKFSYLNSVNQEISDTITIEDFN